VSFAAGQTLWTVEILSPKSGEAYRVGDTMTVQWVIHAPHFPTGVIPLISPDEGRRWLWMVSEMIEGNDPSVYNDSVGTYTWIVRDSLRWTGPGNPNISLVSQVCQVEIATPYDIDFEYGVSEVFSIQSPGSTSVLPGGRPASCLSMTGGREQSAADMFNLDGRSVCSAFSTYRTTGAYGLRIIRAGRAVNVLGIFR
jgi:hypothetical protein